MAEAMCRKTKLIVLIMDSRGAGIQEEIDKRKKDGFNIKVLVYRGRGVAAAANEAEVKLAWWRPEQIYLVAGICDITRRDKDTKMVSLRLQETEAALETQLYYMKSAADSIAAVLTGTEYKLIFAELTGMCISTYNQTLYPHEHQSILDDTVMQVNNEKVGINRENGCYTPWLARHVHKNKKNGSKVTKYHKLSEDGLHLTQELKEKWAMDLLDVIYKNTKG